MFKISILNWEGRLVENPGQVKISLILCQNKYTYPKHFMESFIRTTVFQLSLAPARPCWATERGQVVPPRPGKAWQSSRATCLPAGKQVCWRQWHATQYNFAACCWDLTCLTQVDTVCPTSIPDLIINILVLDYSPWKLLRSGTVKIFKISWLSKLRTTLTEPNDSTGRINNHKNSQRIWNSIN